MDILLHVDPSPTHDAVLRFSRPLVTSVARSLTLVTSEDRRAQTRLHQATQVLGCPAHLPITARMFAGDMQRVLLAAAQEQFYDLALFGPLPARPLERLLPVPRSTFTQRFEPSLIQVRGTIGPIQHILLASGGDQHTFANARLVARLAAPLGAQVTVLHVLSQEQICFELIPDPMTAEQEFLYSDLTEASVLDETVALLREQGIAARIRIRIGAVIDEVQAELHNGTYNMLAIGAHRSSSALDRILFEDMAHALLEHSHLPVLVVKGFRA
jgi:nucleotide-binding universal stress UspA family protein